MTRQYISDIVTIEEISKWQPGNTILINSMTGSGKSQMIKDVLYIYCKENNKKILLLSNRNALKGQNQEELGDEKSDVITLKNYQALESSIILGNEIESLFKKYDYICFDECHYLLSDSAFNLNTDILLTQLKNPINTKIYIFMSATPDAILTYHEDFTFKYNIQKDYSYIKDIYFFSRTETLENILEKIPPEDKLIYFGSALDAQNLSLGFSDSSFMCSENNKEFYRKSSKSVSGEIKKDNMFKSRYLFTTKVIDNGVNIIDKNIKHIVLDLFDTIDLIQCIGRKRIKGDDDRVTLYIKNYHGGEIYPKLQSVKKKLDLVYEIEDIGKEEFQKKNVRTILDPIIQNNFDVNQAKLYYYRYLQNMLSKMIRDKEQDGYKKYVCERLGFPYENIKIAELYFEKENLTDILESYLGKKLYKGEEQDIFKEKFFNKLFVPKRKLNLRNRGYNTINTILQEDKLPYYITSIKDRRIGSTKDKKFWIINKIDMDENEDIDSDFSDTNLEF
jgi:hypothetical protein